MKNIHMRTLEAVIKYALHVTAECSKTEFRLHRRSEWENKNGHRSGPILPPFIRLGRLGRPNFYHTPEYTLVRHWNLILRVELSYHLSHCNIYPAQSDQ